MKQILKKILLYNSPDKVAKRLKNIDKKNLFGYFVGFLGVPVAIYFFYNEDLRTGIGMLGIGLFQIYRTKYYPDGFLNKSNNDSQNQ